MKIAKKYLIILFFLLTGFGSTSAHPFYVSICQVYFNRETESLEISLKTFADDIAAGLEKAGHGSLYIGEEKEDPKTDTYLFDYLKSKIKFKVNGKPVDYQFVGKELEDAVVWTYLEIPDVTDLQSIDVVSNLLTEVYDTQSNVIQVEKDKEVKNLLLSKRNTAGTITF